MPKNDRPGELVLENRHLLLTFFAVVALCGIFFALGYIVGRNTLSSSASAAPTETTAAAASVKPSPMPPAAYLNREAQETTPAEEPSASGTDLSFYQSVEKSPEAKLAPPESPATPPASEPAPPAPESPAPNGPVLQQPPAGILVQVSALGRREDADTLVQLLQERNLPVLVMAGTNDPFFHVMVGPYQNEDEA
ncbi:MAG: SPOR domain-containing protein, partial [Acidobacteria bacterium]|nr:SPOR domain-containing protein [Acidobacteriota bacterium]